MFSCPGYVPMETNSHICVKNEISCGIQKNGHHPIYIAARFL